MTRETYFKIAESQGLATMREQNISMMGSDNDGFMKTGKSGNKSNSNFPAQRGSPTPGGMKKTGSGNFVSVSVYEEDSQVSSRGQKKAFSRRHHSIDQVIKSRGANRLIVDDSVYSFKKNQIRQGNSVSIASKKLAPINDGELMKAMLTHMGKAVMYSATPSHNVLTLNEQSLLDINEQALQTQNSALNSVFNKTRNSVNNTQTTFLSKKLQPHLPALNETFEPNTMEGSGTGSKKNSPKRRKFFFATR